MLKGHLQTKSKYLPSGRIIRIIIISKQENVITILIWLCTHSLIIHLKVCSRSLDQCIFHASVSYTYYLWHSNKIVTINYYYSSYILSTYTCLQTVTTFFMLKVRHTCSSNANGCEPYHLTYINYWLYYIQVSEPLNNEIYLKAWKSTKGNSV